MRVNKLSADDVMYEANIICDQWPSMRELTRGCVDTLEVYCPLQLKLAVNSRNRFSISRLAELPPYFLEARILAGLATSPPIF